MGLSGSVVATASFTVDETASTAALLHGLNGARRFFRHQPQGAGSGNRQTQFEAILTVAWSAEQRWTAGRTVLSWPWMARSPRPPCCTPNEEQAMPTFFRIHQSCARVQVPLSNTPC